MRFAIADTIPRGALVTGGQSQAAIAKSLADAGFAVALQCQASDRDGPWEGLTLAADLSDESQAAALSELGAAAVGPIGVLVNAADACERDNWDEGVRATWDTNFEINLRAPYVLIRQFAKALPASREGVVVNLLDQRIAPHLLSRALSKSALWTLTQTMALALAPRIRVNGIVIGSATPRARDQSDLRAADPHEIARAVIAILALPSMTGQMIVPGGALPPAA